jgi:hypothetical protein
MKKADWEKYFLAEAKDYFNGMVSSIDWADHEALVRFWETKMYFALFHWAGYRS